MYRSSNTRRHSLKLKSLLRAVLLVGGGVASFHATADDSSQRTVATASAANALLNEYCLGCHDNEGFSGGLSFEFLALSDIHSGQGLDEWERVLHKTRLGEMPPPDKEQPATEHMNSFIAMLEAELDAYALENPNPGRATLRRLNRKEYNNAVRDLLNIDVDFSAELPADDAGYGFDNIAEVLTVSSVLMDRYLSVASKLSRLAVGLGPDYPTMASYSVPKDGSILNQGIPAFNERASNDLPLDSRGGGSFDFYAPHDATYEITGFLNANTNNEADRLVEDQVSLRVPLTAGHHRIGMTFRKDLTLDERVQILHNDVDYIVMPTEPPEPVTLDFLVDGARAGQMEVPSYHMRPRFSQANFPRDVLQIDVSGPFDVAGPGNTASRDKIFQCLPQTQAEETPCAKAILTSLAAQAYRRPVDQADITPLLAIYESERIETDFTQGIIVALQALLMSPKFLFLIERDPSDAAPGSVHPLTDLELASRLALFLWSSLPDAELVDLAAANGLREPGALEGQVQRMLDDPRAEEFIGNFAGQWLYLRNLDHHVADVVLYPNFDVRLRSAMREETELFFGNILRENRSVLEFLNADYTFLNEVLADHYNIDGVKGPAFRRVSLDGNAERGGLLGQASILTVTSYGNSTSVVRRGQWILENLLDASPPPPPPDIPGLVTEVNDRPLTPREQMERHRSNPSCNACHVKMDEFGFALERFDATGAIRTQSNGLAVDDMARLPGTDLFHGLGGLRDILLAQQDQFVRALTDKLLTYAVGRGMEGFDQPTIRSIVRAAEADNYPMQSLILGVINSAPFSARRTPE